MLLLADLLIHQHRQMAPPAARVFAAAQSLGLARAKAKLPTFAGAALPVHEEPRTRATVANGEVQPAAVAVQSLVRDRFRCARGELVQLSFGHDVSLTFSLTCAPDHGPSRHCP